MARMDVMDAVVKVMEDEGVEVAFGVPGAAILPLYKAMSKSEQIKHYSVRHEEGGTHAADGYTRATGKIGINIGTSGRDRKSTRLNSSHANISYAVFCLKKKTQP